MTTPSHDDALALLLQALQVESPRQRAAADDPGALANAALYYASVGWPVFPLVPGGKTPLTAHGLKDASTDAQTVAAWWQRWPQANVGVVTGVRFDVIDIDAPEGFDSFAQIIADGRAAGHPAPDVLAVAYTGNSGRHLLVPPRGSGNRAGILPGLDYRAVGGYIVAPPSRLDNGGRYVWVVPPKPQLVGGAA